MNHIAKRLGLLVLLGAAFSAGPGFAQTAAEPIRFRIGAGIQLVPAFPGAGGVKVRRLVDVAGARGDRAFPFRALDESFGIPLLRGKGFSAGLALNLERGRAEDAETGLPRVGATIEAGGFAQYVVSPHIRIRGEIRQGLTGHKGLVGNIGADFVVRNKDAWLVSIGPRLTFANSRYHDAFLSVSPETSAATGLPVYEAGPGYQVGAISRYIKQVSRTWGVSGYLRYDRLMGETAASPVVSELGSRNQFSGGLALTYTFSVQ